MVSVPVITNISQATGDLVILQTTSGGTTTYNFYKKGANNTYVAGGGEEGKIYISDVNGGQGDGSIYRCVSGSTTVAVKISENPYAVASTKTNGVYLDTTNGTLTAKADKAATDAFGTVKISTEATNNVKLTVSDGVIAASAGLANAAAAGMVVAVGTNAEASAMTSAFGDTYIVPNVAYMSSFVSAFVPTVDKASYEDFGVVKITNNGNIDCTSGVLTVASAAASVNGVVKIVDTINTAAEGNSSKAVTQAGIVGYVTGQLANYQSNMSAGDGIDITDDVVSVVTGGAIVISSGAVVARDANATSAGVVLITGDSSYIANGSSTVDGHPVAVNPVAVKNYVAAQITSSGYNLQIASPTTRGGFRTSGSATGLGMTTPSDDSVADVLKINAVAPIVITSSNELTVQSATTSREGTVTMQAIATASVDDDANTAARAYDVKSAISTASGSAVTTAVTSANAYTDSKIASATVTLVNGNGIGVSGSTVWVEKAEGLTFTDDDKLTVDLTGPLYFDSNHINVSSATALAGGIVQIVNTSAGIADATNSAYVPTVSAVSEYVGSKIAAQAEVSAGYAATTSATTPALGGVRVVTSGGIEVTSGNLFLHTADASYIGGVKTGSDQTAIEVDGGVIKLKKTSPLTIDTTNTLGVLTATTSTTGVVTIKNTSAGVAGASGLSEVPNCVGVSSFVEGYVSSNATGKFTAGSGLVWNTGSTTLDAQTEKPLLISGDKITIQTATAQTGETLTSAALGAVYVRGAIRSASVITSDSQNYQANTVPTEGAVRSLVDALPYITYTVL